MVRNLSVHLTMFSHTQYQYIIANLYSYQDALELSG